MESLKGGTARRPFPTDQWRCRERPPWRSASDTCLLLREAPMAQDCRSTCDELAGSAGQPGRERYRVLLAIGVLAYLTYINRLGFGVAAPNIKEHLGLGDQEVSYLAAAFMV